MEPPTARTLLLQWLRSVSEMFNEDKCCGPAKQILAPLSGNMGSVLFDLFVVSDCNGVSWAGISVTEEWLV